MGVAYGYSLFAAFFPAAAGFPPTPLRWRGLHGGTVPVYFGGGGRSPVLVLFGRCSSSARGETGSALKRLLGLQATSARRIAADGSETDVALATSASATGCGSVRAREDPVDGLVLDGRSAVDESMLRRADSGREVGGREGGRRDDQAAARFVIRAEKVGGETLLARIIVAMVAAAQRSRAPIQKLADRVAPSSSWR